MRTHVSAANLQVSAVGIGHFVLLGLSLNWELSFSGGISEIVDIKFPSDDKMGNEERNYNIIKHVHIILTK